MMPVVSKPLPKSISSDELAGLAFVVCLINPTRVRFVREWALEYHDVPFVQPSSSTL
jgi:hypothetical protein